MDRAENLISKVDLELLRVLTKKDYAVLELKNKLTVNPRTIKRHIDRLVKIKLIKRDKVPKTNQAIISITKDGRKILVFFDKLLKN